MDIETNKLHNPDKIHCVVVKELDTNKEWVHINPPPSWNKGKYIGHNILEFDAPILRSLWGVDLPDEDCIDTLILSRLRSPKLENGHSLESWGERLNFPKIEFTDFSRFTPEMLTYCKQDVYLTERVYATLMKEVGGWKDAIDIEHKTAAALRDAKIYGFYFDYSTAVDLKIKLEKERDIFDKAIHTLIPPKEVGKRVKKLVPFNPNSPKQVIDEILVPAGWKPRDKTNGYIEFLREPTEKQMTNYEKIKERFEKYGWKLNENNLASLPSDAPEEAKSILKRTIYETRVRKLDEWLNLVDDDGAVHGSINSLGTWTHRMSHQAPNLANISAKKSIKYHTEELNSLATWLGGQMRALWVARPGRVLVGTDAEGIQLRVLAHYMEDKEFIDAVCSGKKEEGTDPHSLNQKRIGLGTRDNAKTFIYAFLLGAGDSKIGEIYGISRRQGADLKASYINSTPGLKKLKTERIPAEARAGFTRSFDGRKIYCNDEHFMMAAYLQGGEAIIMKYAVVLSVEEIRRRKLDAKLINVVHDEMIFESSFEHAEDVRKLTEENIRIAGEMLKLKCPMKGEGKIGKNWLEVH